MLHASAALSPAVSSPARARDLVARLPEMLAFEAPYLADKMLDLRMVATRDEATLLLREVFKYLVLGRVHPHLRIPMFSRRVDEAWHQLALFTAEYAEVSRRFFGEYVHHAPNQGRGEDDEDARPELTLADFAALYRPLFGELSPLWDDAASVRGDTRVLRRRYRRMLRIRVEGDHGEIVIVREPPVVLVRAPLHAVKALAFMADHEAFYVRELPGLGGDEKVALCRALVTRAFLLVAP